MLLHDSILDVNRVGGVLSRVECKHMIDNELSRIIIYIWVYPLICSHPKHFPLF